jgi:hypothetical protein
MTTDIAHVMNDMATKPDIPEGAVTEGTAKEQELESAFTRPGGVLKELALARWRGLTTQGPGLVGDDEQDL